MNKYLSVVLPVYNEEKNIESLMNELNNYFNVNLNFEYEIILIDNCSTDQSFNILSKFISENIKVIKNKKNILYSGSVLRGIRFSNAKYIAIMDTDLQFKSKDILTLLNHIKSKDYDIVFGSRLNRKDGIIRIIISKLFNLLSKMIFKCKLIDLNTGIKIICKESFINFDNTYGINMINPDLYAYAVINKLEIDEIGITHNDRIYGKTSHNLSFYSSIKLFITVIKYFFYIRNKIKNNI